MLRITVQNETNPRRLELCGKLAGPWVAETENAWYAVRDSKGVEIDLTQVTSIDDAGRRLLKKMVASGAFLIARGLAIKALADEINASAVPARRRRKGVVVGFVVLVLASALAHFDQVPGGEITESQCTSFRVIR